MKISPKLGPFVSREIAVLRMLIHPHIIGLEDSFYFRLKSSEGDVASKVAQVIVMPFHPITLKQHILSHGKLSLAETRKLIRQLAEALVHAHSRGVIHRDIKSANWRMSFRVSAKDNFPWLRICCFKVMG